MNTNAATALKALYNYLGDDLQRAQAAFQNCTAEQMDQQYGQSGKTRRQIVAEYQAHQDATHAAIAWVKAQGGGK